MCHIRLIIFVVKKTNGLKRNIILECIVLIVVVEYEQRQGLGIIEYDKQIT